jgi:ribosomal-protein-serine acetyltransferase
VRLSTEIDGLVLRSLGVEDLERYAASVSRNRTHLTSNGDYGELARASIEALEDELREGATGRYGVYLGEELIGRVDLTPRDGTNAVLGYWLDHDRLRSGFATAACRALLRHGAEALGITDVWAGVTHGNDRSVAVLRRLGFDVVGDMGSYTRFHLALVGNPTTERA